MDSDEQSATVEPGAVKDREYSFLTTFYMWIKADGGSEFIRCVSTFCSLNGA